MNIKKISRKTFLYSESTRNRTTGILKYFVFRNRYDSAATAVEASATAQNEQNFPSGLPRPPSCSMDMPASTGASSSRFGHGQQHLPSSATSMFNILSRVQQQQQQQQQLHPSHHQHGHLAQGHHHPHHLHQLHQYQQAAVASSASSTAAVAQMHQHHLHQQHQQHDHQQLQLAQQHLEAQMHYGGGGGFFTPGGASPYHFHGKL